MKTAAILLLALALAGCQHTDANLRPSDTSAICQALIGPIKYNSQKKDSSRYAAAVLALDLKQRNQVGQALRCPQYR